jgi:hypothetical protein
MNRTRAPKGNRAAAPAANCTCAFRIGDACGWIDQTCVASLALGSRLSPELRESDEGQDEDHEKAKGQQDLPEDATIHDRCEG